MSLNRPTGEYSGSDNPLKDVSVQRQFASESIRFFDKRLAMDTASIWITNMLLGWSNFSEKAVLHL